MPFIPGKKYRTLDGHEAKVLSISTRPDRDPQLVIEVQVDAWNTISFTDLRGKHKRYHLGGKYISGPCAYDLTEEEVCDSASI